MTKEQILAADLGFTENQHAETGSLLTFAFITNYQVPNLVVLRQLTETNPAWTLVLYKFLPIPNPPYVNQEIFANEVVDSLDKLQTLLSEYTVNKASY